MLDVKVFGQRDPRWKDEKHGTSNSTIGATGCTISVLATMLHHAGYFDINPSKLNVKLTQNGGYALGNLVIWSKVAELYPKVEWVYRYYYYDNKLAADWLSKGIMPVVEANAAPIGGAPGGRHWIGFVGDRKSVDPWTGKIVDTSKWSPTGMALYKYEPKKEEDMSQLLEYLGMPNEGDAIARLEEHLGGSEKCEWGDATDEKGGYLGDSRRDVNKLKTQISELGGQIDTLEEDVERLEKEISDHECPIVPPTEPESEWVATSKSIATKEEGVVTTINYEKKA